MRIGEVEEFIKGLSVEEATEIRKLLDYALERGLLIGAAGIRRRNVATLAGLEARVDEIVIQLQQIHKVAQGVWRDPGLFANTSKLSPSYEGQSTVREMRASGDNLNVVRQAASSSTLTKSGQK